MEILKECLHRNEYILPCMVGSLIGNVDKEYAVMAGEKISDACMFPSVWLKIHYDAPIESDAYCMVSFQDIQKIFYAMINVQEILKKEDVNDIKLSALYEFVNQIILGPDINYFSEITGKKADGEIIGKQIVKVASDTMISPIELVGKNEYIISKLNFHTEYYQNITIYRLYPIDFFSVFCPGRLALQ